MCELLSALIKTLICSFIMKVSSIFRIALTLLTFAVPLLVASWHGKLIVLLVITWLFLRAKNNLRVKEWPFLLILLALNIIHLLGLMYSENLTHGFSLIETFGPSIIIVWIVLSSDSVLDEKSIKSFIISFVSGVVTLNLASLAFISKDLWDPKNLQSNIILANQHIVSIHPAYVSLFLSFSIFFIIDQYFPLRTVNRKILGWVLFGLVVISAYLIWINSRTGILSFFVAFVFYSFYRFRGRTRIVSLSLLAVMFIVIFSVPFSKERFINTPRQVLFDHTLNQSSDPNIYPLLARKMIFKSSLDLVKWPEILFGYGTGDFRDVLNESLKQNGYHALAEKSMDQHNEYFAQLHRHGIIGLGLFLSLLIIPFRYALKYRSPLLAVFIILFSITALFENVWSAQKGVTFFALFCPLLMLYARNRFEGDVDNKTLNPSFESSPN